MITSFSELLRYLRCDRDALNKNGFPKLLGDEVWKFQILLRITEYLVNSNFFVLKPLCYIFRYLKYRAGVRLGFSIPNNVFGPGLRIAHYGYLVVNSECKVGSNCTIHCGVNIGKNLSSRSAPTLGDNIYIGPGVKIFGDVYLADNIKIGANAVVNRSFVDKGITIAGVPARRII